jgi:hypothetical protein
MYSCGWRSPRPRFRISRNSWRCGGSGSIDRVHNGAPLGCSSSHASFFWLGTKLNKATFIKASAEFQRLYIIVIWLSNTPIQRFFFAPQSCPIFVRSKNILLRTSLRSK